MFDQPFINDPYPTYARLRAAGPIHWNKDFSGGAWLLPRYADVAAALRDPRLSANRSTRLTRQLPETVRGEFAEFERIFGHWIIFLDEPDHGALRRPLNYGFKPAMLERLRPSVERTVRSLLDRVCAGGEMDFMHAFAHPLPALVIAELLGVSAADQEAFIVWSDDIAAFIGNPRVDVDKARTAQASLVALNDYFCALLPERRKRPGDDLISLLLCLENEGETLTAEGLIAQCSMLLFAGHETTRNLLGNGLLCLLRHPDQLALLKREPQHLRSAVRELLRYESPVQFIARIVGEDMELHGQALAAGQTVVGLVGSANRDAEQFEDPDRLDITRQSGPNLAFGFGPHVCIGATVSYLEAEIAFTAILQRLSGLHCLDAKSNWQPNFGFRGLNSLRIRFDPAGAEPFRYVPNSRSVNA